MVNHVEEEGPKGSNLGIGGRDQRTGPEIGRISGDQRSFSSGGKVILIIMFDQFQTVYSVRTLSGLWAQTTNVYLFLRLVNAINSNLEENNET